MDILLLGGIAITIVIQLITLFKKKENNKTEEEKILLSIQQMFEQVEKTSGKISDITATKAG